jgi:hypothetical protein
MMTRHHRKPKCQGGTAAKENISRIPLKKHAAFHTLFPGDWTVERIANELNRVYIDPDWELIPVRRRTHQLPNQEGERP